MSCLRGQSIIMSGARVFGPQACTGDAGDADHCVSLVDCLMEYCDQGAGSKLSRSQCCLGRREPGFQSKVPLINQGVVNTRRHMAAATTSKPERPHPLQISVISIMALQITVVLGEQDSLI